MLKMVINRLANSLEERGCFVLGSVGLRSCYDTYRSTHSVRRDRKPQVENDSGLTDPNLTVWRSINAEHKEVEQVPTDQTESIVNYYKDRWVQEHKDKKEAETISGNEVSTDGNVEKKSLYSQLAARRAIQPAVGRAPGNANQGFRVDDQPSITSYDPFKLRKATYDNAPPADISVRSMGNLKGHENAPNVWCSDKPVYGSNAPAMGNQSAFQMNSQNRDNKDARPQDAKGPYRPSFSMAGMIGMSRMDDDKSGKILDETGDCDNARDDEKKLEGFSYQPSPPPAPDFKSQ